MASGTQGYEAAQQGVIEKIIERFQKRKKDGGGGDGSDSTPNQPASVSIATPTSSMLIEGTTVNQLMSGTSALATTGSSDITKYGEDAVLQAQLSEQRQTNLLLTAQNQLLLSASTDGALSKFDKQESQLEKIEDLSGTIEPEKVKKPKWLGQLLKFLGGLITTTLIPAIKAAAASIVTAILGRGLLNLFSRRNRGFSNVRNMIDVTPKPNQLSSSTSKVLNPADNVVPNNRLLNASKLENVNNAIPNNVASKVKQPVLEGVDTAVDVGKNVNRGVSASNQVVDVAAEVVPYKPNKIVQAFDGAKDFLNPMNSLKKIKKASSGLKASGIANTVPLLSAITGTVSILSGDYANAMLDYADAGADAALLGGATGTAGALAAGLSATASVLGAGTLAGYIGEWTRGVDDWVRGDGENALRNGIANATAGLSGALEIIGTPFRGLFEGINSLIQTGNFDQSNKIMAVIDANIRESTRKFLNMFDFLNIIPDDVGGFGTLNWYGDENVANANQQLLESKGVNQTNEGEVKNASGGSYFLDNPTNFGPFQGGEASGEVVTFTPFGGRELVNEMGSHMTEALQMPFKFAIGGIAAAINQVIGTLGPMGQFLKSAVGPSLGKLVKASGLTNLTLGGVNTGIGNLLTGAPANAGGIFGDLMSGNTGGAQQMAQMFTGQREDSNFSAVLPQGRPVLTSKFGPRNLSYGSNDHKGIDIGVDRGSPVTAMEAGTVTSIIPDFMHGSAVVVTSDAGDATLYGHVDPTVEKGQEVNKGETIAKVKYWPGTGDMAADNTHLHLERHPGGYDGLSSAVDPLEFTKNSSKTLNQSNNVTPSDNTSNNIGAPKTIGSLFMPNIGNKELSQEAMILAQGQQQLMSAIQSMNKSGSNNGQGEVVKSSLAASLQPQTDQYASVYAPLHLQRLGVS